MLTASEKHRAISERPATCPPCRDEDDFRAALPVHLSLLRDALADSTGRYQGTSRESQAERRHVAPTQLTLSQWVSRTARIGDQS
ncbi:hypothetical protein [Streptomyces sp. Ncost-T10-10d]|uniref:hypothetical protein n=1 Tax=Streptomyces sp. Ncost-T10-10d TaxID=1839774 RepID=UPI00081E2EB7|nr:hypothetical protein [Streptomyces sp. Ncost-T10-10d]SCF82947.1 hypothetical protein GA0115254_118514 [Streptomyces sp. Ncost-T10-10d]